MHFAGKTVVITGASGGIGRALAIGFAGDGAAVVGIGRNAAELERTAALCGGKLHPVVGDVSREADVERLFAEAEARHGRVDVLVNNAALYPRKSFLDSSHAEWAYVIEVNLLGVALCCRRALPGMLARGHGRILNMGTFAWRRPIPGASAYATSKAALRTFTQALAAEVDRRRHPDVLVNEMLAGAFRTGMSDEGPEPSAAYPHVRHVASLPAGGPHGETFVGSSIWVENRGLRARLGRLLRGRR